MKRAAIALAVIVLLILALSFKKEEKQYTQTYFDLFDTVTTVIGSAESEKEFLKTAQAVYDQLKEYHVLFDIYHTYEGINNLKTVNDFAGISPVQVDGRIIDMLSDAGYYYSATEKKVNCAMGSVLSLWHEARNDSIANPENAYIPDAQALSGAALHMDFEKVQIDRENSTVFLPDAAMSLDAGAVAKGWAVQRVCQNAPEGLLISVGGNVFVTGPKDDQGTNWVIGIQDPDGEGYVHTIEMSYGCIVTSGDYQRGFEADGRYYHHIIDPDTLMPSVLWRSVTVVSQDSGLADALSTALFILPYEKGLEILNECGAHAVWIDSEGRRYYSPGFQELIRT